MELFAQQVVNALSLGGVYALLALGLAMVFSIMGLINFAHGDLMTIGGYSIWFGAMVLGAPMIVVVPLGVIVVMLSAMAMERIAFRPVRGASGTTMLLTSFAVSIVLQVLFQVLLSARPKGIQFPAIASQSITLLGVRVGMLQLISIVIVVVALVAIVLFLRYTTLGMGMRAAAEDFPVARLMGLRANGVVSAAFAISGFLAGLAAFIWVAQRGAVDPTMGLFPVIKAFIAAVLGGLGSLPGAVLGGFILGAAETVFRAALPDSMLPFSDAFSLVIVLVILMFMPQGLLGKTKGRV